MESFDPLSDDNGAPGMAPLGERVQAVAVYDGRVYYSIRTNNLREVLIRSVELNEMGAFVPSGDREEIREQWVLGSAPSVAQVIVDIAFSAEVDATVWTPELFDHFMHSSYVAAEVTFLLEYMLE